MIRLPGEQLARRGREAGGRGGGGFYLKNHLKYEVVVFGIGFSSLF
jgi:hypothetical protein